MKENRRSRYNLGHVRTLVQAAIDMAGVGSVPFTVRRTHNYIWVQFDESCGTRATHAMQVAEEKVRPWFDQTRRDHTLTYTVRKQDQGVRYPMTWPYKNIWFATGIA